jgi:hypothetical protein
MIPGKEVSQGHQEALNILNLCGDNSIKNRANIYNNLVAIRKFTIVKINETPWEKRTEVCVVLPGVYVVNGALGGWDSIGPPAYNSHRGKPRCSG